MPDFATFTPLDWALLVGLLLLAAVGIYHIAVRLAGYKVLPFYQRSACGSKMHQLAYITEKERRDLIAAGGSGKPERGTQGVPCYTKRKVDEMEPKEGYDAALFSYEGRLNTTNQLREKEERMRKRIREKEAALRKSHDVGLEEDLREERLARERVNRYRFPHSWASASDQGPRRLF